MSAVATHTVTPSGSAFSSFVEHTRAAPIPVLLYRPGSHVVGKSNSIISIRSWLGTFQDSKGLGLDVLIEFRRHKLDMFRHDG